MLSNQISSEPPSSSSSSEVAMPLNAFEGSSPLGLKLRKTQSFIDLIELTLSQRCDRVPPSEPMHDIGFEREKLMTHGSTSRSNAEKLKASNLYAMVLKIGSWERISRNKGDLVAKCYYAKRKLVWEVLYDGLKSKIEIQWSDISAIRVIFRENEPDILEIELERPPLFFQETNPQPRKHTLWQTSTDFTGGQAPIYRRHFIQFPEGTLEKHYEKLLQCDSRLYMLSQTPFPSASEPYFCLNPVQYSNYHGEPNVLKPEYLPTIHPSYMGTFPTQYVHRGNPMSALVPPMNLKSTHLPPNFGQIDSTSPISDPSCGRFVDPKQSMGFKRFRIVGALRDRVSSNRVMDFQGFRHQRNPFSDREQNRDQIEELPIINFDPSNQLCTFPPRQIFNNFLFSMDGGMGRPSSNNWGLNAITQHSLTHPWKFVCPNEENVAAPMNSMYPLREPSPLGTQYGGIGSLEENVTDDGTNDLAIPMSSETMNGDGSTLFDFHQSDEQLLVTLPRVASYPYLFGNQIMENFADEETNKMEWNHP